MNEYELDWKKEGRFLWSYSYGILRHMKDDDVSDPASKDDNIWLSSVDPNVTVVQESEGECIPFKFFFIF